MTSPRKLMLPLLLLTSLQVSASEEWLQRVQVYLDASDKTIRVDRPNVFPHFVERVQQQFPSDTAVHVEWSGLRMDGKKTRGELYSRPGELFVVERNKGWNLITEGAYVYLWQTGHKDGERIKKSEAALVDYALYLTDPGFLMSALYEEYLAAPDCFVRLTSGRDGLIRLKRKNSIEGFEAILTFSEPLWFRGLQFQGPDSSAKTKLAISAPTPVALIPSSIMQLPKGIQFKDSSSTLEHLMKFL